MQCLPELKIKSWKENVKPLPFRRPVLSCLGSRASTEPGQRQARHPEGRAASLQVATPHRFCLSCRTCPSFMTTCSGQPWAPEQNCPRSFQNHRFIIYSYGFAFRSVVVLGAFEHIRVPVCWARPLLQPSPTEPATLSYFFLHSTFLSPLSFSFLK